jgi:WD40 repeat protein
VSTNYILATASFDGTIGVWEDARRDNSEGWDCIAQLEGHESECKWVTWNPTATLMATCGRDKTVWLWECSLPGNIGGGDDGDFECLAVLNGHDGDVKCSVFAPSHGQYDGDEILISASYDDTIRVWAEDAGDWFCVQILTEGNTVWSLALAPGGARFISGSADGSIGIYKFYTARERKEREGASSER